MKETRFSAPLLRLCRRRGWLAEAAWVLPLLLLALGMRLHHLGSVRLLKDEMVMLNLVSHDLSYIFQATLLSPFLPAWHVLNFFWQPLASSDVGLRVHVLLWGLAALLCTYGMVREAAGRRAAVIALALMAVNGFHIYQSQTATPYAFLVFLGAASTWAFLVLLRTGSRAAATTHVMVLCVAFYTHQATILLWGAQLAGVLLLIIGGRRQHLRRVFTSHALALSLGAGSLVILAHQWSAYEQVNLGYVPLISLARVMDFVFHLLAYRSQPQWLVPLVALVALVMAAAGLLAAWHTVTRRQRALERSSRLRIQTGTLWILAASALLPLAVTALAAALLTKDLLYAPRFFALFVPAGIGLFAANICWMVRGRHHRARLVVAGFVLLVALVSQIGSLAFLYSDQRQMESFPIDSISRLLVAEGRPGDVAVVHHSAHMLYFKRYFLRKTPRIIGAVQQRIEMKPFGGTHDRATAASVRDVLERARRHQRAWLVLTSASNAQFRDPERLVEKAFDDQFFLLSQRSVGFSAMDPVEVKLFDLGRLPAHMAAPPRPPRRPPP